MQCQYVLTFIFCNIWKILIQMQRSLRWCLIFTYKCLLCSMTCGFNSGQLISWTSHSFLTMYSRLDSKTNLLRFFFSFSKRKTIQKLYLNQWLLQKVKLRLKHHQIHSLRTNKSLKFTKPGTSQEGAFGVLSMLSASFKVCGKWRVVINRVLLTIRNIGKFVAVLPTMQKVSASCSIRIRFLTSSFACSSSICTIQPKSTDRELMLELNTDQEFTLQHNSSSRLQRKLRRQYKKTLSTSWGRLWPRLSLLKLSGKLSLVTKISLKEQEEHVMSQLEMLSGRSVRRCLKTWKVVNDLIII